MFKNSKFNLSKLHPSQYIYIVLWALFLIFLLIIVLLSTLYRVDETLQREMLKQAKEFKANLVAGIALVFVIVLFGAIISTTVIHGFVLKKAKAKQTGGNK
ncbi:hypothetical protein [Mycoplasma procyoni]|uniref:hypothetical protein n=1 Tax=Mycoplasma procyoni TaxID=568784 RepID=UPI00197B5BA7|nr:hypothetical protein [Mycoplasma procyoni]MBN3534692.1 hypothetical protein [Mycoplasma procyoni]